MFSRFFIYRPIAAAVISVLIVLGGVVSYRQLPVAKYPDVTPPVVRVSATYPGASAEVIADTVAAPIEQQVNGVDGMMYMAGTCNGDGSYTLDVTFRLGVNVDIATVLVQNRVNVAEPRLPEDVRRQGITTQKQSTSMVGVYSLYAPAGGYTDLDLSNYLTIYVNDVLKRINGVGDTRIIPAKDYSMRVWLDPEKLKALQMTAKEVLDAMREQNVQVAAGQIGQPPVPSGQDFQLTVNTLGRLRDKEQFENIIVKSADNGRLTYLKDVARVERGAKSYDTSAKINGQPGANVIVYLSPGGNAVQVAEKIRAELARLKQDFPPGVEVMEIYDVSRFVSASIEEVYQTLLEAIALVVLVILVFLQNWRSTLIPLLTIPVALVGTFTVVYALGFSVNMLTLFGLVLAIGIVVDDAIVVVENVERNLEGGTGTPREATVHAMNEVTGAIVAISLVLMAVFLPSALLPGITGQLYRQFAVTIAVSTLFSAINALTLSPALCGLLLRGHAAHADRPRLLGRLWAKSAGRVTATFSRVFNAGFDAVTRAYARLIAFLIGRPVIGFSALGFGGVLFLVYLSATSVPSGFLPNEDQGLLIVNAQLPDGASQERTVAVLDKVEEFMRKLDGVQGTTAMSGFSVIYGNAPNYGTVFAALEPWEERERRGRQLPALMGEVQPFLRRVREAQAFAFILPAIDGLGSASGFDMRIEDKSGMGYPALQQVADEIVAAANTQSRLRSVNTSFRANTPQLFADIDRVKARSLNVPLQTIYDTLGSTLGSAYVNDFNEYGRTWQVTVQAEGKFRNDMDDVKALEVRNSAGKMLPLGAVLKERETLGPNQVYRYNLFPSASILGEPAGGISTGDALNLMEQAARDKLPRGAGFEWTAIAYQEREGSGQAMLTFALAILVVYLILAFQYESLTLPVAVVLSVPVAVLGAMAALLIRNLDNNVFTQIGLVLLVGLAAKNAILIVEFARDIRATGKDVRSAAVEAARLRFRPILMTSFAFILGVYPLVVATGAGAASRQALGTAVFGGMIGSTLLGLLFTPVLYVLVQGLAEWVGGRATPPAGPGGLGTTLPHTPPQG